MARFVMTYLREPLYLQAAAQRAALQRAAAAGADSRPLHDDTQTAGGFEAAGKPGAVPALRQRQPADESMGECNHMPVHAPEQPSGAPTSPPQQLRQHAQHCGSQPQPQQQQQQPGIQQQAPPQRPGMPSALPSFGSQVMMLAARAHDPLAQPPASVSASAQQPTVPDPDNVGRNISDWAAPQSAPRHNSSGTSSSNCEPQPSDKENIAPGARLPEEHAYQLHANIGSGGGHSDESQVCGCFGVLRSA
jgi:hypothetical protein